MVRVLCCTSLSLLLPLSVASRGLVVVRVQQLPKHAAGFLGDATTRVRGGRGRQIRLALKSLLIA